MLSALRRSGVSHALRAAAPKSLSTRLTPKPLQWSSPSVATYQIAPRSLFHSSAPRFSASAGAQEETQASELEQIQEFSELKQRGLIDPTVIRTITEKMNIQTMTDVQRLTIHETLKGKDVLAQAKTGTGKTIAFLLPVIQRILNDPTFEKRPKHTTRAFPSDIRAIIISPTRELAEQIATEAEKLTRDTGLVVQTAVGGTQKREGLRRIQFEGCHILVGTPGRLNDILSDPSSRVRAPRLAAFVLDEADRLLDDGFAPAIEEIQDLLPDPTQVDRQTLLFSATVPREVMRVVRQTMKPDFQFVKTVQDDEVPTHLRVPQKAVVLGGYQNALPAILELTKNYLAKDAEAAPEDRRPFKAIVYFNATKQVNLAYEVFNKLYNTPGDRRSGHVLGRMNMYELHSRLTQNRRTNTADRFRKSTSSILFSSDVTARGMDFPDVTHVIQVATPRDRPSYIHRLGRTGRANKTGEGWIFLHPGEAGIFHSRLGDLPIEHDTTSLTSATVDMSKDISPDAPAAAVENISQVKASMEDLEEELKEDAWVSQLGTLNGIFRRTSDMVQAMEDLALHGYMLPKVPSISSRLASAMGIGGPSGFNVRGGGRGRSSSYANETYRNRDMRDRGRSKDRRGDSFRGAGVRNASRSWRPESSGPRGGDRY